MEADRTELDGDNTKAASVVPLPCIQWQFMRRNRIRKTIELNSLTINWPNRLKSRLSPGNIFLVFYCLMLVSLYEFVASLSCCCSPSYSGLCLQRCCATFLGCNHCLLGLLLPFYHLPFSPLTSNISKLSLSTQLLLTGYLLFYGRLSVNSGDDWVWKSQYISIFLRYSDQPKWHQQPATFKIP